VGLEKPLLQFSTWQRRRLLGSCPLGYWWRRQRGAGEHKDLFDLGLTPVFESSEHLTGPYVEAGIGAHVLSHSSIGDKAHVDCFQFGDHIGVGYRFGVKGAFDLSLSVPAPLECRYQSSRIRDQLQQLRLQYRF
jgi:hypothetical protein